MVGCIGTWSGPSRGSIGPPRRLTQMIPVVERRGARMAESRWRRRSSPAESFQVVGSDSIGRTDAERALEATSCVVGLSEPGSSGTEVGLLVSRLQVSRQMDHSRESKRAAPSPARPTASGKGQRPERA